MSKFHCFFRTLVAVALIVFAIKNYYEIENNHGFVSQNIRLIGEKWLKNPVLNQFRGYSKTIYMIECALIALSGLFLLINNKLKTSVIILGAVIDVLLVHNPVFYAEPKYRTLTAAYVGLIGVVINN